LYTHGFLIVSIVSAHLQAKLTGATHRHGG
jgi:hypothetical protein